MDSDDLNKIAEARDLEDAVMALRECSYDFEPLMLPYIMKNGDRGILVNKNLPEFSKRGITRLISLKTKQDARNFATLCKKCHTLRLKFDLNSPYASCAFVFRDHEFSSLDEINEYLNSDEIQQERAETLERRDKIARFNELREKSIFSGDSSNGYIIKHYMSKIDKVFKSASKGNLSLDIEEIESNLAVVDELFSETERDEEEKREDVLWNISMIISGKATIESEKIEYEMYKKKIEIYKELTQNDKMISPKLKTDIEEKWRAIEEKTKKEIEQLSQRIPKVQELEEWVWRNLANKTYTVFFLDQNTLNELVEAYSMPFFSEERVKKLSEIKEKTIKNKEEEEESLLRAKEETARRNREEYDNRPDIKTLRSLRKQYNDNLTKEQKEAIIIYQSALFGFFTEISSTEGYKTKSADELWEILKERKVFEMLEKTGSLQRLIEYRERHKNEKEDVLLNIINKVIPEGCKNISFGRTPKDNCMQELIENIKTQLEIIENIPKDAIVLPQDVVTYRGIQLGDDTIDSSRPSKGLLMSTSLSVENAQAFNNEDILFKLHLKKGTPVVYSPYYIVTDEFDRISLVERSEDYETRSNEVVVNMGDIANVSEIGTTAGYAYGFDMIEKFEDEIRICTGDRPRPLKIITVYECDIVPTKTYEVRLRNEEAER